MITSLMPVPKQQYFAIAGIPLIGGKIFTYAAGTSTPKATYTDSAGTIAQANPIVLNSRGEPTSAIYWSGSYKIVVQDALGNTLYTVDNYNTDPAGLWSLTATFLTSVGSSLIGFLQAGAGAVVRTVQAKLRDWVHVDDYGAVGDGITDDEPAIMRAINSGASRIMFGQKAYRINKCLNLTDRGTRPIKLCGVGAPFGGETVGSNGTTIVGYTPDWMIDSTGSSFTEAEDMLITGVTSKGGWLQARSAVGTYALYNRLKKVYIYVPTAPTFSSVGSIALFCDNVENQVVEQCWFEGDTAYVTSMNNELAIASVYSTISGGIHSNTDVSHRQTVYKGITGAAMLLIGQSSSTYDQCFWQKITGNAYAHAIVTKSSLTGYLTCQKVRFTGQIENYEYGFLLTDDTTNFRIDLTTAAVNTALIRMTGGTKHYGLEANMQTYVRAANKRLLDSTTVTPVKLYGGRIVAADGSKLDSPYIQYIGTDLQLAGIDTHDNAQFNYAVGSTYTLSSMTSPLFASAAFTAGTLANGASFGGGASCPGAAVGDFVKVSSNADMQGCSLTAYVSAPNTVAAIINNNTGVPQTFVSALYKFVVTQA